MGKKQDALESFEKAIVHKTDITGAYLQKGILLQGMDKHKEAIEAFDKVLVQNPLDFSTISQKQISLSKLQNSGPNGATGNTANMNNPFFGSNFPSIFMQSFPQTQQGQQGLSFANLFQPFPQATSQQGQQGQQGINLTNFIFQTIPQAPSQVLNKSALIMEATLPLADAFVKTTNEQFKKAQVFVQEGMNFQGQFKDDKALESFNKAIALDPKYSAAHHLKSVCLSVMKRYEEAIGAIDEAIALRPDLDIFHLAKAIYMQESGRDQGAIDSFNKVLSLGFDIIDIHFEKAKCLLKLGKVDEGLESLDKVLVKAPECLEALKKKASILQDLGKHEEAVGVFEKVTTLMPKSTSTSGEYYQKGLSLQILGRNAEAIQCFMNALELTPGYQLYIDRLNQLLSLKEKAQELEQELEQDD